MISRIHEFRSVVMSAKPYLTSLCLQYLFCNRGCINKQLDVDQDDLCILHVINRCGQLAHLNINEFLLILDLRSLFNKK
jgi:hypothetical protein